ncbi:conserved oligomeric Golgi complex subunit 7-like [Amphibalanus amphitrite]|uniref:conserved oligomeric Golgi complex subunit 7-like n=1 Tax=Amphibalanus amphitrite TaxID=1232801 RepID=UPI001C92A814|nr:conserved oligomeric Golgi complex subunit 7-like [Amphibalanus amphitrite]
MDLSAFSDEKFDVKQWVGQVFEAPEMKENPEGHAATVVMKLQLFIQEVNNSLDETSHQVLQSLPRLVRDVEAVRAEAARLREQMSVAKADIVKVEQETAQSMRTLTRLDTVKSRMERTCQALKEADNWTTLSADVEEVLESGSLQQMADKVAALQQSLDVLGHVSDYEERRQTLEEHRNRLEATASPHLVAAITDNDTARSLVLVEVFRQMARLPQLEKYYVRCQRAELQRRWSAHLEARQEEGVLEWLTAFSETLVDTWHTQTRWLEQVMPHLSPASTLCCVLADTLASLQPSVASCLDTATKEHSDPLQLLEECKRVTDRLVTTLLQVADATAGSSGSVPAASALVEATYAPYVTQLQRYGRYQEQLLVPTIKALVPSSADLQERVDAVGSSVSKLMTLLHSALDRCLSFTYGYCLPQLLDAFQCAFETELANVNATAKQLESQPSAGSDWTVFHASLRLLQAIGDLMTQTSRLEERVLSVLSQPPGGVPAHLSAARLLSAGDQSRYQQLVDRVAEGDSLVLLEPCHRLLDSTNEEVQKVAFRAMFAPIRSQLKAVETVDWEGRGGAGASLSADLPDFSYTPQEYITQVGQYLMTLPQHLEPFMTQHDPTLGRALQSGVMPYSSSVSGGRSESESSVVHYIISCLSEGACQVYADTIVRIQHISAGMTRQLVADIDYLGNVLDDLGLRLAESLHALSTLLRCPATEYGRVSAAAGQPPLPPRLVAAVRQMRGLVSES